MMKKALLLLVVFAFTLSFAQYYDIAIVRANDSIIQNLVYDDNSTSYKDNSIENPDCDIRICAMDAADLQNKYIILAYADGFDGDYIVLTHFPAHITSVPPSLCVYATLEISSFRAWYPSIPYVFISDSPTDFSGAERWKLSRIRGWFDGNYTLVENKTGAVTTINVTDAIEDTGASIIPDVDYLVVGLVREDYTTMDTGITSPNDTITLNADSSTAIYRIYINGIGPDTPPYVEIITPEPITYHTGTIPFTYIMFDDDDIVSCWYILDGTRVDMPACGPAYILNVGTGSHALTLYANDTTGNIGSDSVNFQVGAPTPPGPPGGGPPGTPFWPRVPPPPPFLYFSIIPEDIYVIIDYPQEGVAEFSLVSTVDLENVTCHVTGDFAEYTTVDVANTVPMDGIVDGTITVDMLPTEILDYDRSTKGLLQCVGQTNPTLVSSTLANVYLIINRPTAEPEDITIEVMAGEEKEGAIPFVNTGEGNSSMINISVAFMGAYSALLEVTGFTRALQNAETGIIDFRVDIPEDFDAGIYRVPFTIYENNRQVGDGVLTIDVKSPPVFICIVPDLIWTLIILLIGLILSIYMFRKKLREEYEKKRRRK